MVLRFKGSLHTTLWGAESWEISAHPSDSSVLPGGGTLHERFTDFPLLFKVIDAKTRLSVQVHPNEETCKVTGGDAKTEMWCALSDGPIYAGLKAGTTAADVEAAARAGGFEELLVRHDAKTGDVFFIPGGLVHAIGDGVRLYEVQQGSTTTFRLHDWGRVGADGRPRELHIEKGLKAVDCTIGIPRPCTELKTPFFDFSQRTIRGSVTLSADADGFLALFTAQGGVELDGKPMAEGASALLEPGTSCVVSAEGSRVLVTRFKAGKAGR